ncbi:MAG TPA: ANTAR domain-containing protein [Acidimicrobiales bacterium]
MVDATTDVANLSWNLDSEAIRRSRSRLAGLLASLSDEPLASKNHLQDVVAELGLNVEELLVAEEELRAQTDELAASRDAVDEERERYGELFEFAPDAYLVTDERGTIAEANGAAARMLGVASRFLEGKLLVSFAEESSRRELRNLLNELREAATVDERYIRLQPRDRPPFVAAIRAVSRPAPGSDSVLVRWMVRDVTSRLDLEEEIRFLHVEVDLLAAVARVARLADEPRPVDSLLQSVIDLAASALPGCELGLALSVTGPGARARAASGVGDILAASGERARRLDQTEADSGDGPCAAARRTGAVTEADLARCLDEWPQFGAVAAELGLVTAIGLPIETASHRGAMNVFAFVDLSRDARQLLPLLADQVTTAVANAERYESSHALAGHLERALESRGVIERAKGVLIARQRCDQDQAFDILRRASQRLNRKLHDIAVDLVANASTGEVPEWAPWTSNVGPGGRPERARTARVSAPGPPEPRPGVS